MKYTSPSHPDRITLQMALANLEGITGYLNEAKRLTERKEVVNNLSSAVTRLPFRLTDSKQRWLHRQDVVTRLVSEWFVVSAHRLRRRVDKWVENFSLKCVLSIAMSLHCFTFEVPYGEECCFDCKLMFPLQLVRNGGDVRTKHRCLLLFNNMVICAAAKRRRLGLKQELESTTGSRSV